MSRQLSDYERRAREQIHQWKNPKIGWFGQTMRQIGWPASSDRLRTQFKNLGDSITEARLFDVINKSVAGTVRVLADAAGWTVRPDAVYAEFRKAGHGVHQCTDVVHCDLEEVDGVVGRLDTRYVGLAFMEGAAAGATGVPGLIVDIPTLVTLNLRAIAEYATYYGFDVASQRERLFAMHVLGLASSPDDAAKTVVMAQLAKIAAHAARKEPWKVLEKRVLVKVTESIAKALGIRLTKAKLAQAVPIMGAVVGGGFNAYYTARVCDAAYYLYRERFLAEKYGPEVIDMTEESVDGVGFEPRYPEAVEQIRVEA